MIPHLNILIGIVAGLIVLVSILLFRNKRKNQKYSYPRSKIELSTEPLLDLTDDYESDIISIRTLTPEELQARAENKKNNFSNTPKTNYARKSPAKSDQVLIMHLHANKGQEFQGYELLQALLSNGMRFGEMNIFHRYQNMDGHGPILFSMASAVEPGTFDIESMGAFSCPGLSFFLRLKGDLNEMKVFELMLDTVRQLAEELDGIVYDANRAPLTSQSITNYKLQISRMRNEQPIEA